MSECLRCTRVDMRRKAPRNPQMRIVTALAKRLHSLSALFGSTGVTASVSAFCSGAPLAHRNIRIGLCPVEHIGVELRTMHAPLAQTGSETSGIAAGLAGSPGSARCVPAASIGATSGPRAAAEPYSAASQIKSSAMRRRRPQHLPNDHRGRVGRNAIRVGPRVCNELLV